MQIFLFLVGLLNLERAQAFPSAALNSNPEKNWAVLVAGSNGWGNYRHQADIFHAYHVLRENKIPEEQIITLAFDDIAHNPANPFPGKVFNDYRHKDVYEGVKIDYNGTDVNPQTFIQVLKGDKELNKRGKKVLRSGPTDHVFIYFSDHGSDSLLAFPDDVLYARQLNETFRYMYEKNMYDKMVVYIEACESGSMFYGILPGNMRIYVTTASNREESSWAAYCSDPKIDTCLADEYSHNWLVDSEKHNLERYTLNQQFVEVKRTTRQSHVSKFGDMSLGILPVAEFQGNYTGTKIQVNGEEEEVHTRPARRAHLTTLSRRLMEAKTEDEHEIASRRLHRALQLAHIVKHTFEDILQDVSARHTPSLNNLSKLQELECYELAFNRFQNQCFTIQQVPEVAEHAGKLRKLCERGYTPEVIIQAVHRVCG